MRVLITGSTGFIGSVLLRRLKVCHPEAEILCIGRGPLNRSEIIEFNPEYVLHLAAYNTSSENKDVINDLIDSNICFGVKLLEIVSTLPALKLFINTGSFSQYAPKGDAYLYSASKSAFEVFLQYYANNHGIKYIIAVPYSVYGGKRTVKRIFDYLEESLYSSEQIKMTPGMQQLDFIHVEDIADFYIRAMENANHISSGKIFHLGWGKINSLRQIASIFEKISGLKCNIDWGGRQYRDNDIMYACAPCQKNTPDFWKPTISIEQGIKRFLSNQ